MAFIKPSLYFNQIPSLYFLANATFVGSWAVILLLFDESDDVEEVDFCGAVLLIKFCNIFESLNICFLAFGFISRWLINSAIDVATFMVGDDGVEGIDDTDAVVF